MRVIIELKISWLLEKLTNSVLALMSGFAGLEEDDSGDRRY